MPHLVILYTANLESETSVSQLCRELGDVMLAQKNDADQPLFPTGGTRVLAYPAPHFAVADGSIDGAFVYLQLRMAAGRSEPLKQRVGDALLAAVKQHFAPVFKARHLGITLQIEDGAPAYDGKHNNMHALFN